MNKLQFFCFILSIGIFTSILNSKQEGFDNCEREKKDCKAIKFETKDFQCCNLKLLNKGEDTGDVCWPMLNPIKQVQDKKQTEEGKMMIKEVLGYVMTLMKANENSIEVKFDCIDGNLDFKALEAEFTEEEKKKFNSGNHCLEYSHFGKYEGNITNETCYNGALAAVGNTGISCGYYEIKKNNTDGTTTEEKKCFLFEEDIPKTKNMELGTK